MCPLYKRTLVAKKILKPICAFIGDRGIVKTSKSWLTHPRVTLGIQKKIWGHFFSEKYVFCENLFSGSGDINMFVVDRQTD
jgi:hypothetical protein